MWAILRRRRVALCVNKNMLEGYDNKQIGNRDFKKGDSLHTKAPMSPKKKEKLDALLKKGEKRYFFPGHGVVKADSLEDATLKLNYQKKSKHKN